LLALVLPGLAQRFIDGSRCSMRGRGPAQEGAA
jgi:hypothetical protein